MAVATVIIPCGERHLPLLYRAVRSAYAQTVPVDVAVYIDRERKGPAYGRNRLAEQVTTPFIVQLDADDWLLPHAVETWLDYWKPGYYVTSDWYQGAEHTRAPRCYGVRVDEGEKDFHLPPSLFPTAYWKMLGGQDESMFGAEDTDFFFKANAARIRHIVVREPLFHYTPDGYRSNEARNDPRWTELIAQLFSKYKERMTMACCDGVEAPDLNLKKGDCVEGDLIASPVQKATQKVRGLVSGRDYGRIGSRHTICLDPRDYAINPRLWTVHNNWVAASPTEEQIAQGLRSASSDRVKSLAQEIAKSGIRTSWEPVVTTGYDIQQTPLELAEFLIWCKDQGVKTVLEIGTGASAGLARFLVKNMGWKVTSLDKEPQPDIPELASDSNWTFIQVDTQTQPVPEALAEQKFDLLFIDGDHSYEGAKADHKNYDQLARIVAFHDIAPEGWWADGSAKYWTDISRTEKLQKLKAGYHEVIIPEAKQGIGWYERT